MSRTSTSGCGFGSLVRVSEGATRRDILVSAAARSAMGAACLTELHSSAPLCYVSSKLLAVKRLDPGVGGWWRGVLRLKLLNWASLSLSVLPASYRSSDDPQQGYLSPAAVLVSPQHMNKSDTVHLLITRLTAQISRACLKENSEELECIAFAHGCWPHMPRHCRDSRYIQAGQLNTNVHEPLL